MKKFRQKLSDTLWVKIVSYALIPLYIFFALYTMEYLNHGKAATVFSTWGKYGGALWFSVIIVCILSAAILLISKKIWIFTLSLGALSIILGVINCMKLAVNGDPFYPWDVTMAGNMGELVGFAEFNFPPFFFAAIPIVIVTTVLLWLGNVGIPLKWYFRLPTALLLLIAFVVAFHTPAKTEKLLQRFGMSYEDSVLQSASYKNNGFVNAFAINCLALKVTAPEGYSAQAVEDTLEKYEKTEGTKTPDIVLVMSEAFYDIRELKGTAFSKNPLENYDEIITRDNALSGMIYTTAHGGGTVRTEFEVLTGLTVDYLANGTSPYLYVSDDIESYVTNYKAQGYTATAIHTYDGKFYQRNTAYPYIGFDEFIALDEIKDRYSVTRRRGYITDDIFTDAVIDTLNEKTDTPQFIFGITMENHGKYDKSKPEEILIEVKNDNLDETRFDAVTTYTQGLYSADKSLKELVDYIDSRERPTLLVFFGDHKPALGGYQKGYNQAGNIDYETDGYDTEENKFIYSTNYLMYANYDVDYGVLNENPDMSTYYLLSHVAKITDTDMTPYMNCLYENALKLPYYNVRLGIEPTDAQKPFIRFMEHITYHRIK